MHMVLKIAYVQDFVQDTLLGVGKKFVGHYVWACVSIQHMLILFVQATGSGSILSQDISDSNIIMHVHCS